jgi:hypothetical protein
MKLLDYIYWRNREENREISGGRTQMESHFTVKSEKL